MRGLAQGRVLRTIKGLVPMVLIGFGLAGAVAPRAAQAQFFGGWGNESWSNDGWGNQGWGNQGWGGLRPGEINRAIAQQGFRVIAPLRRNGAVFVADVIDRRGRRERLVVAALDAQILQRYYLDDPSLPGRVPRSALAGVAPEQPMDRAERGDLVPPANIPGAGRQSDALTDPADERSGDRTYGNRNRDDGFDGFGDPQRSRPNGRPAKPPKPRIVERTPDTGTPRDLTPPTVRTRQKPTGPGEPADANSSPAATLVDRPAETVRPNPTAASAPATPAAPASAAAPISPPVTTTRLRDPLAIPGGEPKGADKPAADPARVSANGARPVAGTAVGRPAAPSAPAAPAKAGDVPVAPLD